ncbi:MAG: SGNH/GDSL hydrolase family protein [Burkholderiales bacterium]
MKAHVGLAAALPIAPLLLWQGRRVRRDTPKLPEADGPREGVVGADRPGRPLRLLIVGDSSAAGVGAGAQDDALAGRLCGRLSARLARPLAWRLVARTGTTTREALALIDAGAADRFDVAVVALGVNDVTALRPVPRWLGDVARVHARLHERHRVRRVLWSGLPPMHRFPALPQPLRGVMGLHARALDAALGRWCAARPGGALPRATHVPLPAMSDPSLIASDGFHPGPGAYLVWADALVPHVLGRHG